MDDVVKTEAEAIKLAEGLLEKAEALHKKGGEDRAKKTGKDISSFYTPYIYTLQKATVFPQGWILIFLVENLEGALVEPDTSTISVNKHTGEAKFGHFRDDES